MKLEYRSNGNNEQINVDDCTKDALNKCKSECGIITGKGTPKPTSKVFWPTRWRGVQDTGGDDREDVENPGDEHATVYEPTSDIMRFEEPKIKKKQRESDKATRRAGQDATGYSALQDASSA